MPIKLAVLIPAGTSQYNDLILRAIKEVQPEDISVDVFNLSPDEGHECIQGRVDLMHNSFAVVKKSREIEAKGYQGIFLSDFDMCGVEAAREAIDIPIIGGFTAAAFSALALCQRFSIITILDSTVAMQREHAYRHSMIDNLVSIRSIGEQVGDLTDMDDLNASSEQNSIKLCMHPPFQLKKNKREHAQTESQGTDKDTLDIVMEEAKNAVQQDGAESILLGCTGFIDIAAKVTKGLEDELGIYIPVIDTNHAGFSFLISLVRMRLKASRKCYIKINKI